MEHSRTAGGSLLQIILLLLGISLLLHFGAVLFVPLSFGLFIAFALYPFCSWLEQRGLSRYLSISIGLVLVFSLFLALTLLLIFQFQQFRNDIPSILQKAKPLLQSFRQYLNAEWGITTEMLDGWIYQSALSLFNKFGVVLHSLLQSTMSTLVMLLLIPVHAALLLYHRASFAAFVVAVFGWEKSARTRLLLADTVTTYAGFIKGMAMVYLLVGVLNSVGLLALGIRHAVLFGMVTAIMTIIPYVGIVVSALLPITVAFITKDSLLYPLGVIAVFSLVQYLEANIIFPAVVGKQIKLSTWATLIAIVAGGIIWGVAGMVLFVPFAAILKIIAKEIPAWQPLYLLLKREDDQSPD